MKTLEQLQARIDELEAKARQVAANGWRLGCPPGDHFRCEANCDQCWLDWWGLE